MEMTMNANINAEMRVETHIPRDAKLEAYARRTVFDRPTLIIDTALVKEQYRNLKAGLGDAHIHYAVKANPHPAVISTLVAEGCHFDAASRGEIELVLEQGAKPEDVSFGNTIKRASDIAWAYEHGIRLFAADSEEEIKKIESAILLLSSSLQLNDADLIISHTKNLNALTESFAAMLMDQSVGKALKGQSIDKVNL
jgi:diaminopimelate decarboxylase